MECQQSPFSIARALISSFQIWEGADNKYFFTAPGVTNARNGWKSFEQKQSANVNGAFRSVIFILYPRFLFPFMKAKLENSSFSRGLQEFSVIFFAALSLDSFVLASNSDRRCYHGFLKRSRDHCVAFSFIYTFLTETMGYEF